MTGIESGENKIPKVDMQEEEVNEVPSPYKAGMEELLKLDILKEILKKIVNADYVDTFQAASKANLEIRRFGPDTERLFRKGELEMNLENFSISAEAFHDAADINNTKRKADALFLEGVAKLFFIMEKIGVIPRGLQDEYSEDSVETLLKKAKDCFTKVIEINPKDEETKIILQKVAKMLDDSALQQEETR